VAWIEALVSARAESSPDGGLLSNQNDASFSTERLRNRMHEEGLGEEIIKDCEEIVHSKFSQYHTQMKQRCEEYVSFISSLPQQLEVMFLQDMPISILVKACYPTVFGFNSALQRHLIPSLPL
jgi:hypothetical protein